MWIDFNGDGEVDLYEFILTQEMMDEDEKVDDEDDDFLDDDFDGGEDDFFDGDGDEW